MPSTSKKQRTAMAIACHDPEKSTSGIPKDVACEFNRADAKKSRAKRKVKEAIEYLETLKMIESLRQMSFTQFLVEDSTNKAPNAADIIQKIQMQAEEAADKGLPGAIAFLQRVKMALAEPKPENRLMGAVRARDAFRVASENADISFEHAEKAMKLCEAVEIPADASHEKLTAMMAAAKKAMSILTRIKDADYRAKRHSEITRNMNKIRAALKKAPKKEEATTESAMSDAQILEEARKKHKKPSAGLTKKQKSSVVKKAVHGKDVFHGGFKKVEKAAKKGGAKDPQAVAAAQMWKMKAKKAAKESLEVSDVEVDFIVESLFQYQKMMRKMNKVFEKHLDPENYDNMEAIKEVALMHGPAGVKGFEVMTEDEQQKLIKDTCKKYGLCEAIGDEEVPAGMDDAMDDMTGDVDQDAAMADVPAPTTAGKTAFKLSPDEIGQLATKIATLADFPPEGMVGRMMQKLQQADIYHLTPEEVIMARKVLNYVEPDAGGM